MKMKEESNKIKSKILKLLKLAYFLFGLIMTYAISEITVDYLVNLDVELLKRGLNIILVVIFVIFNSKK